MYRLPFQLRGDPLVPLYRPFFVEKRNIQIAQGNRLAELVQTGFFSYRGANREENSDRLPIRSGIRLNTKISRNSGDTLLSKDGWCSFSICRKLMSGISSGLGDSPFRPYSIWLYVVPKSTANVNSSLPDSFRSHGITGAWYCPPFTLDFNEIKPVFKDIDIKAGVGTGFG
jgi:hypothetical protein